MWRIRSERLDPFSAVVYLFAFAAIFSGCGGGSSTPPPPISMSFSGGTSQTIGQDQSVAITAIVVNDTSGKGVTWTLTGPGALNKQTSTSVEYDAPPKVANNATATITAAAVADPSKSAVYTVNLAVISVSISPASANVAVNATQSFAAAVQYDGSNAGVVWSLMQGGAPCSPTCGSVASTATASGTSTTYTPPSSVPANATVTLTATSVADTTRTAAAAITIVPLPISVAVSPGSADVIANTGFGFTATVLYDAANAGVAWSLTQSGVACSPGCGTVSPTSTASGVLTTYTAPPTVPANPAVTLTATSVSDTTKLASATLTVIPPPISVSVDPRSVLMGVNSTQQFTATVQNDPADKGVTWSLTESGGSCSPGCGTIVPASAASGEAATYTAPATPQSNKVALSATSVADPGKSNCPTSTSTGCVAITVTSGTVKLVPAKLNFGRVHINAVSSMQITLTNTGTASLTITSIGFTGGPASLLVFSQTNTCPGALEAAASCSIAVSFKPTGANQYGATLVIADSSVDSPQQVSLTGKGQTPPAPALRSALAASTTIATPSPTGPNSVGTRLMQLVDFSRRDPYAANGTVRELLVRFWYPASPEQGCKSAEYTSPKVWTYFSEMVGVQLPTVATNSCLEAPVANGKYPILVFTHGFTGTFTDYTFLFEDLASRGYIVASVDHTYEATAVEFPDGRFVESIPGSYFARIAGNNEHELALAVDVRLRDLRFTADQLEVLNTVVGGPFAGRLDTAHMAIAGHSLGGLTAFLSLEQEPRFKAAIILDGVVPEDVVGDAEGAILMLTMGHSRNDSSSSERRLWSELHGPHFLVNLQGAEHLTPTDLVWLAKGAIRTGTMGPDKTIAAIRNYAAAFLGTSLRGQPLDPLLSGPSADYPDADLTTALQSLADRK